jgi:hypothetical protein
MDLKMAVSTHNEDANNLEKELSSVSRSADSLEVCSESFSAQISSKAMREVSELDIESSPN